MAFVKGNTSPIFQDNTPELISIYKADGTYTEMPRAMHKHDNAMEIILVRNGSGVHIIDGKSYLTRHGDLLIINSGVVHDESAAGSVNLSIYSCAITNLQIPGLPPNHLLAADFCPILQTGKYYHRLASLMDIIFHTATEENTYGSETAHNLLRAFLLTILALQHNTLQELEGKENKLVLAVRDYADEHYMEALTLNGLAGKFHVNAYYLAHIFSKMYKFSLMQYVTRRRIGEAQTMLIDTDTPITDIALQVGYASSSHFNKAFNKIAGMSPSKYRQLYRKI